MVYRKGRRCASLPSQVHQQQREETKMERKRVQRYVVFAIRYLCRKKKQEKEKKISRNPPNHFSSDIILEERPQKTPLPNNPSSHIPRPPRLLRLPLPGFQPLARVQLDRPPRLQLVRHRRRLHLVRRAAFGPGPARKFSPVLLIPNLLVVRVRAVDFVPGGAAVAVFCCCCCFSGCGFGGCLAAAAEEEEDAGEEQGEGGADADDDAGDGAAGDGRVVG